MLLYFWRLIQVFWEQVNGVEFTPTLNQDVTYTVPLTPPVFPFVQVLVLDSILHWAGVVDELDFAKRLQHWTQHGFLELGDKQGINGFSNTIAKVGRKCLPSQVCNSYQYCSHGGRCWAGLPRANKFRPALWPIYMTLGAAQHRFSPDCTTAMMAP